MSLGAEASAPAEAQIPDALEYALSRPMGAVAGVILASAQAYVLRRAVREAGWWLLANALAWMLGMPIVFLGASTIGSGASGLGQFAPIWLAMVAAGAVVGAGAAHPRRRR